MHLVTYLHPRLPTDSAEEPGVSSALFVVNEISRNSTCNDKELAKNFIVLLEFSIIEDKLTQTKIQGSNFSWKKWLFVVSSGFQKMLDRRGQQVDDADERVIVAVSPGPAFGGLEDAVERLDARVAVA